MSFFASRCRMCVATALRMPRAWLTSSAAGRLLRDEAEPRAALELDVAAIGLEGAADEVEQRRLAGAVAADEPDALARRDLRRGILDQGPAADPVGEARDGKHGARDST